MTTRRIDWDRIGRYLAGELPPEDAAEVRRWLDVHRGDAELVAALERLTSSIRAPEIDIDAALRRVKSPEFSTRGAPRATGAPRRARWFSRPEVLAVAATIVLFAGIFLFERVRTFARNGAGVAYTTTVGQRDSVRLADGTVVILGPATRVFAKRGSREVVVEGEAFFRVVHDDAQPFVVRAGQSVIRDIGTEFAVRTDDAAEAVRVVVREGIVAVSGTPGDVEVTLRAGDVAQVAAGRVEAVPGAATPDDLAWTRGELVFRDAPMSQVVTDLRRWYGVEVRVADPSLLQRRFTGTFTTESRDHVLDVIAMALPARVERRGDTAHFRPATSGR